MIGLIRKGMSLSLDLSRVWRVGLITKKEANHKCFYNPVTITLGHNHKCFFVHKIKSTMTITVGSHYFDSIDPYIAIFSNAL